MQLLNTIQRSNNIFQISDRIYSYFCKSEDIFAELLSNNVPQSCLYLDLMPILPKISDSHLDEICRAIADAHTHKCTGSA